ncbi:MAG: metallophosphoesterase family protein [Anaerolineales bacterium]|nr:metallophosphoesterase family protein [Anaerolineales bacterium]
MKVAILSDIHGNSAALQSVTAHIDAWQPDHVIVNGDVVNRGPDSAGCWQFIQARQARHGWRVLGGNHEMYVCKHTRPTPDAEHRGIRADINQNSRWTYKQLDGEVAALAQLPATAVLTAPDGSRLWTTHASIRSNSDGIYPASDDDDVARQIAPATAVFVTSHIHVAYTRQVNGTLLVNTGSAGQLCDGDSRASYAQVTWQKGQWHAKIVRLPYDWAATDRAFHDSGFLAETGPVAWLIYLEWKTAVPLLPAWRAAYFDAVVAGHIPLERSVTDFLHKHGLSLA